MPVAVEQRGAPPNGLRRAWEQGRKRRKGVNPRSRPWVASIDAAGAQVREPPRWELEPRRFPQCSLARMPHALVQIPSFRGARPETFAASMDATRSLVRAQRPLSLLWPSSGRIVRSRLAAKGTKGSNARSAPCVASIGAAGLRIGNRLRRGLELRLFRLRGPTPWDDTPVNRINQASAAAQAAEVQPGGERAEQPRREVDPELMERHRVIPAGPDHRRVLHRDQDPGE
ncbi:MAG: hypothetical protein RLZZ447_373 [Verrucomicrobiota bacterium]